MKRFKFRLQKLLNLETQREQQEEVKLQSLISKLRGQELMLQSLKEAVWQSQRELSFRGGRMIDAQHIMLNQNYIMALNDRIGYQSTKVDEVRKEVDDCMVNLISLQKNRKIVEKLRDKDKVDYIVVKRKVESKQLDDIAISRRFFLSSKR